MRFLFILVLLLTGCAATYYYPPGVHGTQVQYYTSGAHAMKCDKCGKMCYLFKKDSKGRTICPDCFEKIAHIRKVE